MKIQNSNKLWEMLLEIYTSNSIYRKLDFSPENKQEWVYLKVSYDTEKNYSTEIIILNDGNIWNIHIKGKLVKNIHYQCILIAKNILVNVSLSLVDAFPTFIKMWSSVINAE